MDLGTVFAKFFKSSVSPLNSGPSSNPFSQGSNTVTSLAPKTPFLLLSAPPSPLHILSTSASSLSRVPSGKSTIHTNGISAPSSPSHSTKPQTLNSAAASVLPPLQQVQEEQWTGPQTTTSSPTTLTTILVRPASNPVITTSQSNHSNRSPRHIPESSVSGWNTKSMLFTLPDIGEEGTEYEDSHHSQG